MQKSALGVISLPVVFIFGLILSLVLVVGGSKADACTPNNKGNNGNGHQNASAPAAAPVTSIGDRGDTIKEYLPELKEASNLSGFPISLIAATIHQESGWDPNAVSGVGAQGLAQFMPYTWPSYGGDGDPFNPRDAIRAMGRYMGDLKRILRNSGVGGDEIDNVLRAYNAGPGAVIEQSGGWNTYENDDYAPAIRAHWQQYQTLIKDLGIEDYPTGEQEPSLSNVTAQKATTPAAANNTSAAEKSGNAKKECKKEAAKKDKDNTGNNTGSSVSTDSSGDDYPWGHMAHCDAAYTACPSTPDPTNALPRECVAFAAWRVTQQTGGSADNITFHSPGNAEVWRGHWIRQGWEIGNEPRVGAIVYYAPGASGASATYGHVAVVKQVNDDGTFLEEGYNGLAAPQDHQYYTRTVSNGAVSAFLYIPGH